MIILQNTLLLDLYVQRNNSPKTLLACKQTQTKLIQTIGNFTKSGTLFSESQYQPGAYFTNHTFLIKHKKREKKTFTTQARTKVFLTF